MTESPEPSGADLARQALEAARARTAANRTQTRGQQAGNQREAGTVSKRLRRKRWSAPGPDSRDPQPLAGLLGGVIKANSNPGELMRATIAARWATIVGATLADHCNPTTLTNGELTIQCESTAWATQVKMLAPQLVAKINQAVGQGSVTRVRAQGPGAPSWRFGPRHIPGRGPRDTYG